MTTPLKEVRQTVKTVNKRLKAEKENESSLKTLLGCEPRLNAQITVLLDMERSRVHEWYGHRLKALEEWARKQPEPIREAVFGCLAAGSPLHERTGYAAQLNRLKYALEESEREVLELRAKSSERLSGAWLSTRHPDLIEWEKLYCVPLFIGAAITVKPVFEYYEREYYEGVRFTVSGMGIDAGGLNICLCDEDQGETDGFYIADLEPFRAS